MAQVGPLLISAHNAAQAEYVVKSRAEQRGVSVDVVEVSGSGSSWLVTLAVADEHRDAAADLGEDTQVLHFSRHPGPADH